MAAGILIGLGKTLKNSTSEAHLLMDKVADAVGTTVQRLYVSYAWLLHATFKVCSISLARYSSKDILRHNYCHYIHLVAPGSPRNDML